jgi:hypothetical protein
MLGADVTGAIRSRGRRPSSVDLVEASMEFTLRYLGTLVREATAKKHYSIERQRLRVEFHKQLKELWQHDVRLHRINPQRLPRGIPKGRDRFEPPRNKQKKIRLGSVNK